MDAEVGLSPLYNRYTVFGAFALLGSTVFAALTYTVSDVRIGLSDEDVRAVLAAEPCVEELRESLIRGYADWIAINYRQNVSNTPLIIDCVTLDLCADGVLSRRPRSVRGGPVVVCGGDGVGRAGRDHRRDEDPRSAPDVVASPMSEGKAISTTDEHLRA